MSFYCAIRAFKWTGYILSIPGRTGHFIAPSTLLSGPARGCLYRVGQVIFCTIRAFNVDQLDVIYSRPERSFTAPSGILMLTVPSRLLMLTG